MFPPLTKGKKMISAVLSSCSRASALAGTVVLLCVPATTNAATVQYWVKGTSEQSGWTNTFQFYNGCWAASSSDMVNWWQNRISEKYKYPEDKRVSAEDFNRELEKNSDNAEITREMRSATFWKRDFRASLVLLPAIFTTMIRTNTESILHADGWVPKSTRFRIAC